MPTPIRQKGSSDELYLETFINRKEVLEFHIKTTKHSSLRINITGLDNKSNLVIIQFFCLFSRNAGRGGRGGRGEMTASHPSTCLTKATAATTDKQL